MLNPFLKRAALAVAGTTLLAGSFYAGTAWAADPKLDDALSNIDKAIALLNAATNPGVTPPFGAHRDAAVLTLKLARSQVEKAKAYANAHPSPDGGT